MDGYGCGCGGRQVVDPNYNRNKKPRWNGPVVEKHRRLPVIKLPDKVAQNILYALPRVASVSLFAPINIVQGIYAKHYGLALTTIAGVILFVRLFDAITDPIIGYLSDKSRIKTGHPKALL